MLAAKGIYLRLRRRAEGKSANYTQQGQQTMTGLHAVSPQRRGVI
jgi:hypothetical protein